MKLLIVFFTLCFFCVGCGVKDDPNYQSKNNYNKKTILI